MGHNKKYILLAKIALFLTAIIWGFAFVIMKNTLDIVPPNFILFVRFLIGAIFLSVIFHKKYKLLNFEYLWQGAIIGLCLFSAFCIQTFGLLDTTPGKNAFLTAIYCVLVPILSIFFSTTKPDKYNISAAFICIVGIGFVSLTEKLTIAKGDALTLISGFFYALHIVVYGKFSVNKDPILITILQFAFASFYGLIATVVLKEPVDINVFINKEVIICFLYLGILSTGVALLLQNIGQSLTDSSSASLILSLESVFGVIFSVIFGQEVLTLKVLVGFMLIFIAVVISETKLSFLKNNN